MDNRSLVERDLQVLWHPCTQMKDFESYALTPIRRGEGVWLEDFDGNRYIDAISSWWVNLFGHSNKRISDAIQAQAAELEHVIFASFSHEPGVKLAERLLEIAPAGLQRCFYADNGSSAVEVALKMSFHYWLNTGRKEKTRFVGLSNAYHGETLGALAVGDVSLYKETYEPLLLKPLTAPSPDCFYREAGELEGLFAAQAGRYGGLARTATPGNLCGHSRALAAMRRLHADVSSRLPIWFARALRSLRGPSDCR